MKRRFFFGLLTPGRIIFILILIYIALLTVPYLRHKKVSENFKNDFRQREFYSSQTGSERIAYINDNTDALLYRLQIIEQEPAALAGDDGMDRVAEGRLAGIASASSVVGAHRCVISVKFGWRGFFVAVFHEGDGGGQPRLDGIAHGGMPEGEADDGKDVLRQAQKRRNLCDAVPDPSDEAAAEPEGFKRREGVLGHDARV